jgi:hypothetical protein
MAIRNWNALSGAYRRRLEKAGVTRKAYESGGSLAKARGHAKTPERPERAEQPRNRERYKEYRQKRSTLIRKVNAKKDELFGHSPKYRPGKSHELSETGPSSGGKPPSIQNLRKFLDLSYEEFESDYAEWWDDIDEWGFLYYH